MKRKLLLLIALMLLALGSGISAWAKQPLGLVGKIQSINGNPYGIDVKGNTVYLVEFTEGMLNFQTYDISNPKRPVLIGMAETGQQMDEIVVRGNRAYIANDALGLSIFDISHRRSPFLLGQRSDGAYADTVALVSVPPSCSPCALVGYFYYGFLKIYDVSDPFTLPDPISYESRMPPSPTGNHHLVDIAVEGKRAYLWGVNDDENNYIDVIDLSTLPAPPVHVGLIALPFVDYGDIGNLAVSGRYVYLVTSPMHWEPWTGGGLHIVDVKDPATPRVVGSLPIPDIGLMPWQGPGLTIAKQGRHIVAYMVGKTALHLIDVSNPGNPTEIASYPLPDEFGPMEGGFVVVRGAMVYVAASRGDPPTEGHGGLAIYRIPKNSADF